MGDQRGDVLDLALHRVRQGVVAVAAPAAVVGDDGEAAGQGGGHAGAALVDRPVHEGAPPM
jgi:hypothetical protein